MHQPRSWALLSAAFYLTACMLPALRGVGSSWIFGWTALVYGWMPLITIVPWLANPILLLGWLLYWLKRYGIARFVGLVAASLAVMVWVIYPPFDIHVGYYLWQASFLAFTTATSIARRRTSDTVKVTSPAESHDPGSGQ